MLKGRAWLMGALCFALLLMGFELSFDAKSSPKWQYDVSKDWNRGYYENTVYLDHHVELRKGLSVGWEQHQTDLNGIPDDLAVDGSGNVIVSGYTLDRTIERIQLIKYAPGGHVLWQRAQRGGVPSRGTSVDTDRQGNIYLAGFTWDKQAVDYIVFKFDPDGNLYWERTFSGGGADHARAIDVNDDGFSVITGNSNMSGIDILTAKYDPNGNRMWDRRYNSGESDWAWGVAQNYRGEIFIAGSTVIRGQKDVLLLKYNASGQLMWQRQVNHGGEDVALDVAVNRFGQVAIAGYSELSNRTDLLVAVFDEQGNILWTKKENLSQKDRAFGVTWQQDQLLVTGSANLGIESIQTLKFDANGNRLWKQSQPGAADAQGRAIATDAYGNIFVTASEGNSFRTFQYQDGYTNEGMFQTHVYNFGTRIPFKSIAFNVNSNQGSITAVVEVSDNNFSWISDSLTFTIHPNQSLFSLRGLKPARYIRVRFELESHTPSLSPYISGFTVSTDMDAH